MHPSLLPRWRGAAPVERAIMAGDAETGVTIHRTIKELDAGPIAAQRAFPIEPEDDAGAVYAKAAELAVELLDDVLPSPTFTPQADRRRRRTPRRSPPPTASSTGPTRRTSCVNQDPRTVAAHRRAGGAARPPGDGLEGARRAVGGSSRSRCSRTAVGA